MMNVRLLSACLVCWLFTSQMTFGQNAGLVAVIGEAPERVEFQIPVQSPYKFQYDPARITLWDSIDMQNAIPSGTAFLASAALPGCEVDLSDFAALQTCFSGNGGGVALGCNGFDTDADNDVALDDYAAFQSTIIGPDCNVVIVPVFVQGLTASTGLGDVPITLLIDPEQDGKFAVEAIQAVTVASINIGPTLVGLGTELTVTLQPAIPPLAFDATTTANWEGVYQPMVGSPTPPFQVAYSPAQFRESSASQAVLIVADGTITNLPDFTTLDGPGVISGTITLNLAQVTLARSFTFTPPTNAGTWERIHHLENQFGFVLGAAPFLTGDVFVELPVYVVSSVGVIREFLESAFWYHMAVVVRIKGTATTSLVYSNTTDISGGAPILPPGRAASGFWLADDVGLIGAPEGCEAAGYEIAIFGGNGPDYDAHVELFEVDKLFSFQNGACLNNSPECTGIPGTAKDFFGLPGNEPSFLFVPLSVTLPQDFWVYVSVSTDEAGWIIADLPEIGGAPFGDCFGQRCDCVSPFDGIPDDCGICFTFNGALFSSFWAEFYCTDNPSTPSADAPATLLVDLVSLDAAGVEIDRVQNLVLFKVLGDDGDPNHVVYHNNLNKPIMLFDVDLNEAQHPNIIPLHAGGGGVVIVPVINAP